MTNGDNVAKFSRDGKRTAIATPYNAEFVAALKSELKSRRWDPKKKVWTVDGGEREAALEVTRRFFSVIEAEKPPEVPAELAAEAATTPENSEITPEWLGKGPLDIWVDGACSGNPGPGGYGVLFKRGDEQKARSGGFRRTTNNRMEILAVIVALEALPKKSQVVVHSDSKYVVDAMQQGWAKRWKANGWMRNKSDKAVNPDLWERLLRLTEKHDVRFEWVRGHNHLRENEWCDQLALAAAHGEGLAEDEGYRPELGPKS